MYTGIAHTRPLTRKALPKENHRPSTLLRTDKEIVELNINGT